LWIENAGDRRFAAFHGRYAAVGWARLSLIKLSEFPGPALSEMILEMLFSIPYLCNEFR
jgi:hypothetical protein